MRAFYWGHRGARDNFSLQIRNIVEAGYKALGEKPVIIGEGGVPMDMKYVLTSRIHTLCDSRGRRVYSKGEAFKTTDFKWQRRMMDAMITGLERSLVGFT